MQRELIIFSLHTMSTHSFTTSYAYRCCCADATFVAKCTGCCLLAWLQSLLFVVCSNVCNVCNVYCLLSVVDCCWNTSCTRPVSARCKLLFCKYLGERRQVALIDINCWWCYVMAARLSISLAKQTGYIHWLVNGIRIVVQCLARAHQSDQLELTKNKTK